MKGAHINQLLQMRIGEIKDLENTQRIYNNTMGNIIDREKETVASSIEQENINEKWAEDFLGELG